MFIEALCSLMVGPARCDKIMRNTTINSKFAIPLSNELAVLLESASQIAVEKLFERVSKCKLRAIQMI